MKIILASKSPRRQELIRQITTDFQVIVSDVEETIPDGLAPEEVPVHLAHIKAQAVSADHPSRVVVGADTVVILDGQVLGKPQDKDDAYAMLGALSGKTHTVVTGCCITDGIRTRCFSEKTEVTFYTLTDKEIWDYIATGDPFDKAGSYGIQKGGMLFVRGIKGDFFNVMGLPVGKLYRELNGFLKGEAE